MNHCYVIFSLDTGEVLRIVRKRGSDEPELPADGEGVIEAEYSGPLPAYVDGDSVVPVPQRPSDAHHWSWPSKQWIATHPSIEAARLAAVSRALGRIDVAAGQARLRYITSVPGQEATYQRKEQQARDWSAAGFAGAPPSFIAAEALALQVPPEQVATEIIALADYWGDVKGPEIEATRRKWKVAVEASAGGPDEILAIADQGVSALGGL